MSRVKIEQCAVSIGAWILAAAFAIEPALVQHSGQQPDGMP
jgi:hypothetical protein